MAARVLKGSATISGEGDIEGSLSTSNTIYGDESANWIFGGDETDIIKGGAGDDNLNGGDSTDYVYGDDNITGLGGGDILYGGAGQDSISGGNNSDEIYGGPGADDNQDGRSGLVGGGGNDIIYGGDGDDFINGEFDNDYLYGEGGNDVIMGGSHNDYIYGGDGDDTMYGEDGNNVIYGGMGSDTLVSGGGGGFNRLFLGANDGSPDTASINTLGSSHVYNYVDSVDIIKLPEECNVVIVGGASNSWVEAESDPNEVGDMEVFVGDVATALSDFNSDGANMVRCAFDTISGSVLYNEDGDWAEDPLDDGIIMATVYIDNGATVTNFENVKVTSDYVIH